MIAIAAGGSWGNSYSLALKSDGTVVAWGANDLCDQPSGPAAVPSGLSGVIAITAGGGHSLALVGGAPAGSPPGTGTTAADRQASAQQQCAFLPGGTGSDQIDVSDAGPGEAEPPSP